MEKQIENNFLERQVIEVIFDVYTNGACEEFNPDKETLMKNALRAAFAEYIQRPVLGLEVLFKEAKRV